MADSGFDTKASESYTLYYFNTKHATLLWHYNYYYYYLSDPMVHFMYYTGRTAVFIYRTPYLFDMTVQSSIRMFSAAEN